MGAGGCGTRAKYRDGGLRYDGDVTDADGAHIASLLITFFYQEMPHLIRNGLPFMCVPLQYHITQGSKTLYARDDARKKDELLRSEFTGRGKVDIGRFIGIGEMIRSQLKETTKDPEKRTMLRVENAQDDIAPTQKAVDDLMGVKPESRFRFIQDRAEFVRELDI